MTLRCVGALIRHLAVAMMAAPLMSTCSPSALLLQVLADEMKKVCGEADIEVRPGRIEARGHHRTAVKQWLEGLGF